VSLYLPFGADLGAVVAAIVTLGYSNVEIREAQHEATKSRISSSARIPVVEATVDQVRAALRAALPPAYKDARADIDLWPTY
jgi:Holliday junction resolvasome RuvABC DNA-binding subunit